MAFVWYVYALISRPRTTARHSGGSTTELRAQRFCREPDIATLHRQSTSARNLPLSKATAAGLRANPTAWSRNSSSRLRSGAVQPRRGPGRESKIIETELDYYELMCYLPLLLRRICGYPPSIIDRVGQLLFSRCIKHQLPLLYPGGAAAFIS